MNFCLPSQKTFTRSPFYVIITIIKKRSVVLRAMHKNANHNKKGTQNGAENGHDKIYELECYGHKSERDP